MEKTARARSVSFGMREPRTGRRGWRGMLRGARMPRFKQAFHCLFAGRSKLTLPTPPYEGGDAIGRRMLAGEKIVRR